MVLATRTVDGNNSGYYLVQPKIVVMHATRSTIASKTDEEELTSTLNWFINPYGASSHWVISELERVRAVLDSLLAWHSGYLNGLSWGVELTQPTIDRPFTEGHYINAALVGRHYVSLGVAPKWLSYWDGNTIESGFVSHEDTIQGRASGKSDPGPEFDRQRFIASIEEKSDMPNTPEELQAAAEAAIEAKLPAIAAGVKALSFDDTVTAALKAIRVSTELQALFAAIPGGGVGMTEEELVALIQRIRLTVD